MPRPKRICYQGAIYHIFNRGNDKQRIFHDPKDYQVFLRSLRKVKEKQPFKLFAYALMGNHFHLLLQLGSMICLGKIMQLVSQPYVTYYKHRYPQVGHLYQGRYKGFLVEDENYLVKLTQYIHLNPVKAGIVSNPKEYPWSSASLYFMKSGVWFERDEILKKFGSTFENQTLNYWSYLQEGIEVRDETIALPHLRKLRKCLPLF